MNKLFLLLMLVAGSSKADSAALFDQLSPKLRGFLTANVGASNALSDVVTIQQTARAITVFYFYAGDKTRAKAGHYCTGETSAVINLNAELEPIDEYTCLLFELINLSCQERFQEVFVKAIQKEISRKAYPREVLKIEFEAMQKTKGLLRKLKPSAKEVDSSDSYKKFLKSADTFDAFYAELKKQAADGHYDPIKNYERQYDLYLEQYKNSKGAGYLKGDGP